MRNFTISGKMMAEMLLRLGVYDENILSEFIILTEDIKFKLWGLRNSWAMIFPERLQRWLYKRHLRKFNVKEA